MNAIINILEKNKPIFEKISSNAYLRAIRDGFISLIPVVLFSSIFLLIAFVPNIWGQQLPDFVVGHLMKAYDFSMGILGLLISATVVKSLATTFNGKLPIERQINIVSVMAASTIGFLLIGITAKPLVDGGVGLEMGFMGTKGLLSAFLVAFITANIYRFFVKNDIKIRMPEQVPANISQTFADLFPMAATIIFFWVFDMLFRGFSPDGFTVWLIDVFKPIFSAADGYIGLAIIFGAMAFFWFIGIHGPSIVEPAVAAIYLDNVARNLALFQAGEHANFVLAQGTQYFVATIGGTGANLVITYMMALLARSKQLKTIGRASSIPVTFGINEPVLFGVPFVLNPVFMIPFIFTPIINVWMFKFFIDMGMNGFIYNLPWTTPGPLGLVLGTGFSPLVFIMMPLMLVVDFLIYYPFFRFYDSQLVTQESQRQSETIQAEPTTSLKTSETQPQVKLDQQLDVLVLCANGATSSMLATAINKGAKELNISMSSIALAYGQHKDVMKKYPLVVLAPQMASMLHEIEKDAVEMGVKVISMSGVDYINYTRNPKDAVQFMIQQIGERDA
ncbi:PTS transporter subunit EIIC (plasmid) [Entomospira entomophila]|uniref:PTS system lactose-specific EIICB component n=1 Tax=Entomospira entomophila TaxID=2719988 RepID=A0A968KS02_9SPIO|nr:PTS transporter subunit EIIC [Entomospira entomophilus]NIZ41293.1 PTS transporter subunit EIIC [Entomospira entomophilus]WDI36182.1 PTS transporter subunit EIIC [Entomospira entomophilus]